MVGPRSLYVSMHLLCSQDVMVDLWANCPSSAYVYWAEQWITWSDPAPVRMGPSDDRANVEDTGRYVLGNVAEVQCSAGTTIQSSPRSSQNIQRRHFS